MDCPIKTARTELQASEIFVAHSAGTLTWEQEAALRHHLETCADCRRMASAQQHVWTALDAWTPVPVDSTFDEQLFARIAADERKPWWKRRLTLDWSSRPAMPVAAACGMLIAAFLIKSPAPEHQPVTSVQPRVDIEQVERALDDIDMLKQIGVAAIVPPRQPVRSEKL